MCYDSEFPELGRHLVDQGVNIIFVPFCTDERQSYLRVRYCCQARAVENQCYMVMSGNVGNLPGVANMDIQYAQSGIFTPCDFPFAEMVLPPIRHLTLKWFLLQICDWRRYRWRATVVRCKTSKIDDMIYIA
ncbi:MAG: nitrilase-related carbon-nitrogen hydrolase [Thiotrichaceae bacterium]